MMILKSSQREKIKGKKWNNHVRYVGKRVFRLIQLVLLLRTCIYNYFYSMENNSIYFSIGVGRENEWKSQWKRPDCLRTF